MSEKNNGSTLKNNNSTRKGAVNSIQRTLFVERMCIDTYTSYDTVVPYDHDNLYPNKIKSIAQRSGSTKSAIKTLGAFIAGEGFEGKKTVINSAGQSLWKILRHCADSYANFNGFALHFNYNILGQITEITPINFEFVRVSNDLQKYIVNEDWGRRRLGRFQEIEYNPFNPDAVLREINEVGIDNYKGQILYWINSNDVYTTCYWDDVLDDAQFEAEAKLYSLSSIQNDYSLSGVLSYPSISDTEEIDEIKEDLNQDTGSSNAGGIRVISAMPMEGMNNWKWFTPFSRNNIDNLHTNQIERAKFNIYATFRQPPILNGVATSGMFNQESFADAFHYYNSATESERKDVEEVLSKVLSYSVWSGIGEINIQPKNFEKRVKEDGGSSFNNA